MHSQAKGLMMMKTNKGRSNEKIRKMKIGLIGENSEEKFKFIKEFISRDQEGNLIVNIDNYKDLEYTINYNLTKIEEIALKDIELKIKDKYEPTLNNKLKLEHRLKELLNKLSKSNQTNEEFIKNLDKVKCAQMQYIIVSELIMILDKTSLNSFKLTGKCKKSTMDFMKYILNPDILPAQKFGIINKLDCKEMINQCKDNYLFMDIGYDDALVKEIQNEIYHLRGKLVKLLEKEVLNYLNVLNGDFNLNQPIGYGITEELIDGIYYEPIFEIKSITINIPMRDKYRRILSRYNLEGLVLKDTEDLIGGKKFNTKTTKSLKEMGLDNIDTAVYFISNENLKNENNIDYSNVIYDIYTKIPIKICITTKTPNFYFKDKYNMDEIRRLESITAKYKTKAEKFLEKIIKDRSKYELSKVLVDRNKISLLDTKGDYSKSVEKLITDMSLDIFKLNKGYKMVKDLHECYYGKQTVQDLSQLIVNTINLQQNTECVFKELLQGDFVLCKEGVTYINLPKELNLKELDFNKPIGDRKLNIEPYYKHQNAIFLGITLKGLLEYTINLLLRDEIILNQDLIFNVIKISPDKGRYIGSNWSEYISKVMGHGLYNKINPILYFSQENNKQGIPILDVQYMKDLQLQVKLDFGGRISENHEVFENLFLKAIEDLVR